MTLRSSPSPRPALWVVWMLWALSGFSTLTFELVWMREMALWAGNTITASTLVIAVFFASAAGGNLLGARLMRQGARPLRSFARFEILAAVMALASLLLCRWLWLHGEGIGSGWPLRIGITLLLVGPAAVCSGVSFPCLAESFVSSPHQRATTGAPLYAFNLLGATAGVAAGGVLLLWKWGIQGAYLTAVGIQLLAGLLAWRLARFHTTPSPTAQPTAPAAAARLGWVLLAVSGILSLATQSLLLLWMRQVSEGSVYAMSAVLAAFVGGLGTGCACGELLQTTRRFYPPAAAVFCHGGFCLLVRTALARASPQSHAVSPRSYRSLDDDVEHLRASDAMAAAADVQSGRDFPLGLGVSWGQWLRGRRHAGKGPGSEQARCGGGCRAQPLCPNTAGRTHGR